MQKDILHYILMAKYKPVLTPHGHHSLDIYCLKTFDTFSNTSVRETKMNAVACAKMTMTMLQCRWKTFMVHETFVWWALYILYKFVKFSHQTFGPSHRKCRTCPTFFTYTDVTNQNYNTRGLLHSGASHVEEAFMELHHDDTNAPVTLTADGEAPTGVSGTLPGTHYEGQTSKLRSLGTSW